MLHVIAILTAKPGMRAAMLAQFRANIPAVLAEEGCIEYRPAIDAEGIGRPQTEMGPDTFMVIEKWASLEAFRAHGAAPHMVAYAARVRDMLADRVVHVLGDAA